MRLHQGSALNCDAIKFDRHYVRPFVMQSSLETAWADMERSLPSRSPRNSAERTRSKWTSVERSEEEPKRLPRRNAALLPLPAHTSLAQKRPHRRARSAGTCKLLMCCQDALRGGEHGSRASA